MLKIPNPTKLFRSNIDTGEFYVLFCLPGKKNRITGHSPTVATSFDDAVDLAESLLQDGRWTLVFEKIKERSQLVRICDGQTTTHSRMTTKEKAQLTSATRTVTTNIDKT